MNILKHKLTILQYDFENNLVLLMKRFVAYARLGDSLICQAEGPNKKEAQTKAADKALRLETAAASQVRQK